MGVNVDPPLARNAVSVDACGVECQTQRVAAW